MLHMKSKIAIVLSLAAIACAMRLSAAAPFSRSAADFVKDITLGINIGNTLDCPSGNETEWGNRPGGYEGMGLIGRSKVEWSHPEIVDAFNVGRKAADKKR